MPWFNELKRRKVFRVGVAYTVVSWLLIQVSDIVLPALQMPEWTIGFVTLLLGLGFPIALLLAWAYELTPDGVKRTEGTLGEPSQAEDVRRVDYLIPGLFLLLVAFVIADTFVWGRQTNLLDPALAGSDGLRPAIAVLPFESIGGDEEQQIFVDGLADDLIGRLSSWRSFPVIARAATFSPDLPTDLTAMSEYLDARYVVEGSVRREGENMRLVVRLVDASTARSLWSDRYDRPVGNVLALQDEITKEIVGRLNPALLDAESERALRADAGSVDAWTAAHRGWWYVNRETAEAYASARQWFERAIELDPNWGWPHAALALTYYRELLNGWSESRAESVAAVIRYAEIAVNLDPFDPFAHHALGHARATAGRAEESLTALARGVELNPSDAMASSCYGMQLAAANRGDEAIAYADRAMSLSPDDPWQHRFALVLARGNFAIADYSESESWADPSLQLRSSTGAFWHSVSAAALSGELERAQRKVANGRAAGPMASIEQVQRGLSTSTDPEYVGRLIDGLNRAGFGN